MKVYSTLPCEEQLNNFLIQQLDKPFSYKETGYTNIKLPDGYYFDYNHAVIGKGSKCWNMAKAALSSWQHFPNTWTKIHPADAPLKCGTTVVVLIRLFGFWWRNCARIVYTIDETNRFGFAYGTLQEHAEIGEEAFWIEFDEAENVSYHIKAFSKHRFWMARLAYPVTRYFQKKFAKDSVCAMRNKLVQNF